MRMMRRSPSTCSPIPTARIPMSMPAFRSEDTGPKHLETDAEGKGEGACCDCGDEDEEEVPE